MCTRACHVGVSQWNRPYVISTIHELEVCKSYPHSHAYSLLLGSFFRPVKLFSLYSTLYYYYTRSRAAALLSVSYLFNHIYTNSTCSHWVQLQSGLSTAFLLRSVMVSDNSCFLRNHLFLVPGYSIDSTNWVFYVIYTWHKFIPSLLWKIIHVCELLIIHLDPRAHLEFFSALR